MNVCRTIPQTSDWLCDWSSCSATLSTIISAKSRAGRSCSTIAGTSLTSCGYGIDISGPDFVDIHTG